MRTVIIGSGNIATHLAMALYNAGHTIIQIYSRTLANAQALANLVHSSYTNEFSAIPTDADLYLICVSDSAISQVINNLNAGIKGIVTHTSGATDIQVLDKFQNRGVIYPPQSINKNIETDISLIPFGIEANSEENYTRIYQLINNIAPKSFPCSSQQRLAIHVAAVFANNFSNVLYLIAKEILENEQLDFELLKPIILETALKIQHHSPEESQTGPARRADFNIIEKHLQFLRHNAEENKIYQILTDFIVKRYPN